MATGLLTLIYGIHQCFFKCDYITSIIQAFLYAHSNDFTTVATIPMQVWRFVGADGIPPLHPGQYPLLAALTTPPTCEYYFPPPTTLLKV